MPLYWENAKRELREVRHGGDRDYDEYDDHHRRSGYASQNTLEVNHGMLLRKIIQALVELGKKECPQPLATTLILIRLYYDTAAGHRGLNSGGHFEETGTTARPFMRTTTLIVVRSPPFGRGNGCWKSTTQIQELGKSIGRRLTDPTLHWSPSFISRDRSDRAERIAARGDSGGVSSTSRQRGLFSTS